MRNLPDDLVGLLVGLRSRIGIIDAAHSRHFSDQPFRKQRTWNTAGRIGKIIQLHELIPHRISNRFTAIADVHRPNTARYGIEMLSPRRIPDPHPLTLDDNQWIDGFEFLVLCQMMPDMGAVRLDDVAEIILANAKVHYHIPFEDMDCQATG